MIVMPSNHSSAQLGNCIGQLWLYATMDGENIKTIVQNAVLRR